eukprot:gnl/MRDRNA2_/MRDRNA2_137713_c0_seq1.p1 gnl/MRDRNA2_/MRDRNA2_137713_c0~~gnl/MRDRNA2_/MRDRNA2_137713_c0_seq1.p1  ORF type:complete len:319 (-),score=57.21 gnl/MRDRNA2_/MRDRNA2_137713_c0_seq1:853-1809(-)
MRSDVRRGWHLLILIVVHEVAQVDAQIRINHALMGYGFAHFVNEVSSKKVFSADSSSADSSLSEPAPVLTDNDCVLHKGKITAYCSPKDKCHYKRGKWDLRIWKFKKEENCVLRTPFRPDREMAEEFARFSEEAITGSIEFARAPNSSTSKKSMHKVQRAIKKMHEGQEAVRSPAAQGDYAKPDLTDMVNSWFGEQLDKVMDKQPEELNGFEAVNGTFDERLSRWYAAWNTYSYIEWLIKYVNRTDSDSVDVKSPKRTAILEGEAFRTLVRNLKKVIEIADEEDSESFLKWHLQSLTPFDFVLDRIDVGLDRIGQKHK